MRTHRSGGYQRLQHVALDRRGSSRSIALDEWTFFVELAFDDVR
jgi:hypothetical protein